MGAKSAHVQAVRSIAAKDGSEVIVVSAQIEHELSQLAADEARDYLAQLGVTESGLDRLVHAAYQLLGLMTYFTAGEKEVRAWTITGNTRAPQAAGVIHSDFEKGFICAEVYKMSPAKMSAKQRSRARSPRAQKKEEF